MKLHNRFLVRKLEKEYTSKLTIKKFFPFVEFKRNFKAFMFHYFCREVLNFQCCHIFRSITRGPHNPVQLQDEHRSGLTSFLRDIVFILIIYCNCIRLIVHKMASKKQENFEDQDQLGPDHGKVQKNVTSNHPQKICGKCKKLFSTWTNLKKHLLKTHNVKPFTWCHL